MINLNLLPPREKELIRADQLNRMIVIVSSYFISALLIFSIFLLAIFLTVNFKAINAQNNLKETQKKLTIEGFDNIQAQLKNINTKITSIRQIQKDYKYYSKAVQRIIEIIPSDMEITAISANQNQFEIKGFASSRDLVISLKTSLEQSPYFEEINNPLANFLRAENINFTFSFKAKNEAFAL